MLLVLFASIDVPVVLVIALVTSPGLLLLSSNMVVAAMILMNVPLLSLLRNYLYLFVCMSLCVCVYSITTRSNVYTNG